MADCPNQLHPFQTVTVAMLTDSLSHNSSTTNSASPRTLQLVRQCFSLFPLNFKSAIPLLLVMAPVTGRSSPTLWCVRQSWHKPSIHYGDIRTARNVSWHLLVRMLVYPLDFITNQASWPIDTILLQIEALRSIAVLVARDGAFQISSLPSEIMTSRYPLLRRSQSKRHVQMFQFNVHFAPKSIGSTTSITTSGNPSHGCK